MRTLILLIILLSSCNDEIIVFEPYEKTPIIYCTLDTQDSSVRVRIQKSFGSRIESNLQVIQEPDSIYYNDIDVVVNLVRVKDNSSLTLDKKKLSDLGLQMKEGMFTSEDAVVYHSKLEGFPLVSGENYALNVNIQDKTYTANIILSKPIQVFNPSIINPLNWVPQNNDSDIQRFQISTEFNECYAIYANITFTEINKKNQTTELKKVPIQLAPTQYIGGLSIYCDINNLYKNLLTTLEISEDIERIYEGFEIKFYTGSDELFAHSDIALANLGITSTHHSPPFSNFSNGAYGFLTCRSSITYPFRLSSKTIEYIQNNEKLKVLNFR